MFEDHKSGRERKTRAIQLLKSVELEQRVNHFPAKLSGGERQRVAIARSLANSPSVLLADEPTGNLDSQSAKHVLDLLTSLRHDRRMTLILVTHDMSVASRASRALQVMDGRIVFDGDPARLSAPG
jgi:putative ABC transport system ATP-binding protein